MSNLIQEAARKLSDARLVVVLTGAGVSKESGVPTFRDAMDGLWAQYDPMELATAEAFLAHPKRVWDWYSWRRALVKNAQPNPGHHALAQLQTMADAHIITQNVDDLHEQAGSPDVIHLHGNIARNKCFDNCQGDPTLVDVSKLAQATDDTPPRCPHCGAYLRPDVVWFGEMLPEEAIQRAMQLAKECDVMLVVGTSGLVNPAAQLPLLARQSGATIIEVNPDKTPVSRVAHIHLQGASGEILPQIIKAMQQS